MCRRGLVGDHERYSATAALLSKGLESWGDQAAAGAGASMAALKEEGSGMPHAGYNFYGSHLAGGDHEMPAAGGAKSQLSQMLLASSPRSCITTSLGSNMLDFSNSAPAPELRSHHHHSDNSSEVRSIRLMCTRMFVVLIGGSYSLLLCIYRFFFFFLSKFYFFHIIS
jgi:hypothetical protein